MKTILLFITLTTSVAYGQTIDISVAPTTFTFWGKTPGMSHLSIEYNRFGAHYFHPYTVYYYTGDIEHGAPVLPRTHPNIALSYSPIQILGIVNAGAYVFAKKFPITYMGQRVNFFVDVGFNIKRFRVSYHHISNGFGIVTDFNPGVDSIRLTIAL